MLVLTRKINEAILIGDDIKITLLNIESDRIRIGIDAPKNMRIYRYETLKKVQAENIGMILDVPMHVTVELGKAKQRIKDILGYNMGSVIVLDKVAGEAVDVLVNGKRIGRGEVVVIDDNYGVRITEITAFTAEELL